MINPTRTFKLFDGVSFIPNEIKASQVVDLTDKVQDGVFSIESRIGGSGSNGNLKIEYQLSSNKKGPFFTPTGTLPIIANQASGTNEMTDFEIEFTPYMRIVATEIDGTVTGPVTIYLNVK